MTQRKGRYPESSVPGDRQDTFGVRDVVASYDVGAPALVPEYERLSFEEIHASVLDLLPESTGCILDVGAGTGRDAAWFAANGHNVVAVEPSARFRAAGQERHRSPDIRWMNDTLPALEKVQASNVVFIGGVGLGKSHLAIALGRRACEQRYSVLFASAVDAINTLTAAQAIGRLKQGLNRYIKPRVLVLDELGYLPIDKTGADLLFQIVSQRYERGSTVTTNRVYRKWPEIFNNDATLTSAVLDRLLHHAETIVIEGKSFRVKDANRDP